MENQVQLQPNSNQESKWTGSYLDFLAWDYYYAFL